MYFKKVFMDESGTMSYLIGCEHDGTACVINPQKEAKEYFDAASESGMKITHIFYAEDSADSHLNGNLKLMLKTGAKAYCLNKEAFQAGGKTASQGDVFNFGNAKVEIVEDPCHDASLKSIRVTDSSDNGGTWMVLGKESLFVGELAVSNVCGNDLSNKLLQYLNMHNECGASSSVSDAVFENLPDFKDERPVFVSSY